MKTKRVYVVTWRTGRQEFDDGAKAFEKLVEIAHDILSGVYAEWRDEPVPDLWLVNGRLIQVPADTPLPPAVFLRVVSDLADCPIKVTKL